jgi:predicted kinase
VPQTIHLTTGLPASGKTTHARALMASAKGRIRRINLDDIRAMLDDYGRGHVWTKQHEHTAQRIQEDALRAALADGFDVVVDNTHLTPRIPGRLKQVAAGRAHFVVHDFTYMPLEECIRRDARRDRPVGAEAIQRLHKSHQQATKNGWRLTGEWMNSFIPVEPYVPDLDLPRTVVCDLDGTLFLHVARGPYEFHKCESDQVNAPVLEALQTYWDAGYRIVLLSGRPEADDEGRDIRERTIRALRRADAPYHELHMRAAGDKRGDDVVKAELFDRHVRHRFNVRMVLDDRDRVVTLWRRMGLSCWQVAPGDF